MPFLRKWIKTGNVIEAAEYYSIRTPKKLKLLKLGTKPIRGKNCRITTEQQRKLNNRNAVNHLCRILNANFHPNDYFVTLDLAEVPFLPDGEPDEEAVKKLIAKYTRRLRPLYQKAGIEFKYVWVIEKETEQKKVRIHVHMVLPKFSADEIMNCWTFGGCTIRRLDANRDYRGLANYLSKDPTLGMNHKKRWGGSKNLIQPKIEYTKIDYPGGQIKPPDGYKEIIDRSYASDITGMIRYVRYVRMDGADISDLIITGARAGPDPIPIESTG